MEEKKIQHYDCFFDKKKSNLKPFDLQKAREGKPVCTRDGRKARIICFDKRGGCPIIALVEPFVVEYDCIREETYYYTTDGHAIGKNAESKDELMMAPDRHEGWINVYKGGKLDADFIYPTKETAITNIFTSMESNYIDTIKVEWEE